MRVLKSSEVPAHHWLVQVATELRSKREDAIPPGFKSSAELIAESGLGKTQARQILKEGVADGRIEKLKLRRCVGNTYRLMCYYAPKAAHPRKAR